MFATPGTPRETGYFSMEADRKSQYPERRVHPTGSYRAIGFGDLAGDPPVLLDLARSYLVLEAAFVARRRNRAPGQTSQALLTTLYCSTDLLCRGGDAVKNMAHSASFHSCEKIALLKPGTKQ